MKWKCLILALACFASGSGLLLYDAYFFHRYEVDLNDVASANANGIVDWVTGERPIYAGIPGWVYGLALCGFAGVVFAGWTIGRTKLQPLQKARK